MRRKQDAHYLKRQRLLIMFFSILLLWGTVVLSSTFTLTASAATGQSYTDNGDGTITDNVTWLMWQKGYYIYLVWNEALNTCDSLTLGGHSDWRLPSKTELMTLVAPSVSPTINTTYFPDTDVEYYWSSTTSDRDTNYAWGVDFSDGSADDGGKGKVGVEHVRCVRGVQAQASQNNCAASLSSSVVLYIPILTFSGSSYWAYLQYNSAESNLTLSNANIVSDASHYSSCTASTLSSDFKLHIPVLMISGVSYWVDLQWNGSVFVVARAGAN